MKWLVQFSINRPKTVIAAVILVTLFFAYILATKFYINVDPMKSFSRKLDVIKYYHLTLKKFSMKDMILIGVENDKEGIFNTETLRYVNAVINKFKSLKIKKTYKNIITGKEETVEVPSKLSPGQIMSIINADDVMVNKATNTIVIGNLTSKAREKAGLIVPDPENMKKLPASDDELKKLIPYLKKELMSNDLLKGSLFSTDGKACAIMVPIEKRIDNKLEIIRREMPLMVNADRLKSRFSGEDYYFPSNIYNKTVDGTKVDDEFIKDTVSSGRNEIREYLLDLLEPLKYYYKDFYASLKTGEVNEAYLNNAFKMIASDDVYEKQGISLTYQDCIDDLYRFVINHMDRFSRNNLESKLYNVPNIYDVGKIYKIFNAITEKDKPKDLTVYIAGLPVAEALLEHFVVSDLSIFMLLSILVILFILFLSIRTPTGIYLPLTTVVVSIIWLMGAMLLAGIEVSSGTIAMPCILIAVGSSYVIHYLMRYYEKISGKPSYDPKAALLETTNSIDTAIFLSAITTLAAFISDVFIDVVDIQRLGILVSLGIIINFLLTFSLIPAVLVLIPPIKGTTETKFEGYVKRILVKGGEFTARHSRAVFWGSLGLTVFFAAGVFMLKTESSITFMFLKNNPILQASNFINKELTGTGQMCIVFKMRNKVYLASKGAQDDLSQRIDGFTTAYRKLLARHPDLNTVKPANQFLIADLDRMKNDPEKNEDAIENRVAVFTDILNEYYEAGNGTRPVSTPEKHAPTADLSDLAQDYAEASGKTSLRTPQEEGIDNIIGRIKTVESYRQREEARRYINSIRKYKNGPGGKEFQGKFNYLSDFFHTDITQPITLRKIETLGKELKALKEPRAVIDGTTVKPVGNILSITDTLKVIYRVFYHDDNPAFNKIPDVKADGIQDKSLTDRSIIGVCLSQFLASREDVYKYLVTDDMKLMQYVVFMRSDTADFLQEFQQRFYSLYKDLFPPDDPYVQKIIISGMPAINLVMNKEIFVNQIESIIVTVIVVLLSCIFIFRSFVGGLFATVPKSFTLITTLGLMGYWGIPINYTTLINASIAVGAGIDYSIHFIERFKYEHITQRLSYKEAYQNTLRTTGLSIFTATLTVGLGFAVLGFSSFKLIKISGLLVTLSMFLSGTLSLTVLPAMIIWIKPKFLENIEAFGIEEKIRSFLDGIKDRIYSLRN
jgi:predicted RND superfamily exporter protein